MYADAASTVETSRPQATMYDLAMTIYFGMYGATMTTNSELFWGPDSIMMLPYMSSAADAQSAFFQRMTGLGFAIMSLGYAKCGVSKDAWIKQTMLFHVVSKSTSEFFSSARINDGTSPTMHGEPGSQPCGNQLVRRVLCGEEPASNGSPRHRAASRRWREGRSRIQRSGMGGFPHRYLQIAINIALAGWGYTEMAKSKARLDAPHRAAAGLSSARRNLRGAPALSRNCAHRGRAPQPATANWHDRYLGHDRVRARPSSVIVRLEEPARLGEELALVVQVVVERHDAG